MDILLVLAFGVVGVGLRFAIDRYFSTSSLEFPWTTFLINIIGCGVAGLLMGLSRDKFSDLNVPLIIGFCGGFTTFSSFGLQCFQMFERGEFWLATIYVVLTPLACIVSTTGGVYLARVFA